MKLVWKLLRKHISIPQFAGFFLANLFGVTIVLLGFQFYRDVLPVFTAGDSFMQAGHIVIGKRVGAADAVSGRSLSFSEADIDELRSQPFVARVGAFTRAAYRVDISLGLEGKTLLQSEFFIESVPDSFVEVPASTWHFDEQKREVPVILPRSYLTMYNLALAPGRSLPRLSEGLASKIDLTLYVQGNGLNEQFRGRVVGFSSRQTTMLVPQAFIDWSNHRYAPTDQSQPMRLIVAPSHRQGQDLEPYLQERGYEADDDKLAAEKTTYFLRTVSTLVVVVGALVMLLSLFVLMLSIYLLVEKNTLKLHHLMLLGYHPRRVALPYQLLALGLSVAVLLIALPVVVALRDGYMQVLMAIYPQAPAGSLLPTLLLGIALALLAALANAAAVYAKVKGVWKGNYEK